MGLNDCGLRIADCGLPLSLSRLKAAPIVIRNKYYNLSRLFCPTLPPMLSAYWILTTCPEPVEGLTPCFQIRNPKSEIRNNLPCALCLLFIAN